MNHTITTHATSIDGWLAERRSHPYSVGASDVPAILGVSPYRTPWDVWASHHAPHLLSDDSDPRDLARGHALEPAVLRMWSEATGRPVQHFDRAVTRLADAPWATFSPDGITDGGEHVEAKTIRDGRGLPASGVLTWDDAPDNAALWSHVVQAAWTSVVLGVERTHLAVLGPFFDLYVYEVPTDARIRAAIFRRVEAWRATHLVGGVEPEKGRPISLPRGTESAHEDALPEADDVEADAIRRWLDAKAAADKARSTLKWLDGIASAAREDVIALARVDHGPGLRVGDTSVAWKVGTRRTASVGAVEKFAPDLVAKIVKTSTTRRLVVVGQEDSE